MIERSHLTILRELDRKGSLTAAAEALHLTQSALSHNIKKLENLLGAPLWIKEGRQIQLTQVGQYLLSEAKRLLPQLERVDEVLFQHASGDKGVLRIGMECYPCYRWLLKVVAPFLKEFPEVDIDIKQKFHLGGMAALFNHEIDLLVTPDPLHLKGVSFTPVFDYEQVLVVNQQHEFSKQSFIVPKMLIDQTLYSYPVEKERLDIYKQFLLPADCNPKKHKTIEDTEIMLQMVAANRGVATLPLWLVEEYKERIPVNSVRLGRQGLKKQINLGMRNNQVTNKFVDRFITLACELTAGR